MDSLDPRVNRLPSELLEGAEPLKELDQLETFEVFLKKRENLPIEHVGIVHASDEETGFLFAKEQFSRRNTCLEMWIARTKNVFTSHFTTGGRSVYDEVNQSESSKAEKYSVFHLKKRGKQHVFAGVVLSDSIDNALSEASKKFSEERVYNVWIVKDSDIYRQSQQDLWATLPDKGFREAYAYKAGDKLKEFVNRRRDE